MSVKIINIFKEDSFNDILELFRKATASEVILVLPRVGKIFRTEDQFAAFAAEAKQAGKAISVLTASPESALMAKKFGFTVMASGTSRTARPTAKVATLATSAPPADFSTPSMDDGADLGDVVLPADQTAGTETDADEPDPLEGMHVEDNTGNAVDEDGDGVPDKPEQKDIPVADEVSFSVDSSVASLTAALASTPYRETSLPTPDETDYIDSVWRNKNGAHTPVPPVVPMQAPSQYRPALNTAPKSGGGVMSKHIAVAILTASVVVLGGVIYLMSGSAHVALTPVGKTVDTQITVQASDTYTSVDDAFAKIPGQLIEISKSVDNTVPASGNRDVASKARGKIVVYNEYSSTPQTLVATTRFQSDNGKVFRTLQSLTIPGSTVNAGQTVPGKVSVEVVADAPGTDFNIPAGNFTIMAFKEKGDTEKAKKFYGKSDLAMTGGASGPSSVVLQADYNKAKEAATTEVRNQIATAITTQGAGLTVLDVENAAMADVTSTAKPDDAADSVTVTAKGTVKTIAFRADDLKKLIVGNMLNKERLIVLPDELDLTYSDIAFKPDLGTLIFTVNIKGIGYTPIDTQTVAQDIVGKNSQSIQDYFSNREGVLSATVTLSPFWVRSVPKKTDNITIDLVHESPQSQDR